MSQKDRKPKQAPKRKRAEPAAPAVAGPTARSSPALQRAADAKMARPVTPFQESVYTLTKLVPAGKVTTYGAIAAVLGCGSSQAIGQALKHNPFAPVVPCHRVISSALTIGGFSGATDPKSKEICRKVSLLKSEGVPFTSSLSLDRKEAVLDKEALVNICHAAEASEASREAKTDSSSAGDVGVRAGAGGLAATTPKKKLRRVVPPRSAPQGKKPADTQTNGSSAMSRAGAAAAGAGGSSGGAMVNVCVSLTGSESLLATGEEVRKLCRINSFCRPTSGFAPGYAQANLVILPKEHADDFREYCRLNRAPCPLLEVTAPGSVSLPFLAKDCDIRTDLPAYNVYRNGVLEKTIRDISVLWQKDFVSFLLGCSFSFEDALLKANIPIRHIELGCNVPMYCTNIPTKSSGPFSGPLVVSMRPMTPAQAAIATKVTEQYPYVHGGPVHIGDPGAIGIKDLSKPDWGDAVPVRHGEVPVFWACGVTPQRALQEAKLPLAITHAPGHMLVSDVLNVSLAGTPSLPGF